MAIVDRINARQSKHTSCDGRFASANVRFTSHRRVQATMENEYKRINVVGRFIKLFSHLSLSQFPKMDEMVILVRRFGSWNDGTQSDSAWAWIGDGIDCVESERRTKTDVQLVCTHKNPSALFQSPSNGLINDATMPHRNHSSLNRRSSLIRGEWLFLAFCVHRPSTARLAAAVSGNFSQFFLREKNQNSIAVQSVQ